MSARPLRILVVDDESALSEVLAELLRADGHHTLAVESGLAALEAVAVFHPDVVLLDLGLPGMDGFEVAKRLRAQQGNEPPFLVAISGYALDAATLREAAFDHHVIKPPDLKKLADILNTCARRILDDQP